VLFGNVWQSKFRMKLFPSQSKYKSIVSKGFNVMKIIHVEFKYKYEMSSKILAKYNTNFSIPK
jgi:hypothetical protein